TGCLSRKSQIARSSGSSRTPCRSSSRSAKLICRAASRATAQLREPRTAGRRPVPLPIQQQGNRVKNLCCNETCEEVVVPGGDFAFETEAVLAGGLADQIGGDMPERSEG